MKARVLLTVVLLAAASQGYGQDQMIQAESITMPKVSEPCKQVNTDTDCYIEVVVSESGTRDDRVCDVRLKNPDSQDLVGILKAKKVFMKWKLESDPSTLDYKFTGAGIEFLNNDPPRQFVKPSISADGLEYAWTNKNGRRKVYEYVINVKSADGQVRCDLDPWIRNQ